MPTTVYAFNSSPSGNPNILLTVRSATTPYTFTSAGPDSTPPWVPTGPNTKIPWGGTNPGAGQIGYGANSCILNDGLTTSPFTIVVPTGVGPTDSLQIYLFYSPPPQQGQTGTVSWVLLKNGQPIGGSLNV